MFLLCAFKAVISCLKCNRYRIDRAEFEFLIENFWTLLCHMIYAAS